MAKTKTPFLSLGAQGSVGESITSQKRGRDTVLRRLPTPTDPYSLPQAYQRWLYQDYAYLWTKQNAAIQAEYRSLGSRIHLTGFQYWMKAQLANLPDLAAWWKLDTTTAPTTPDSSRNNNLATIFGASPADGLINGCFYFDGLNDYLQCAPSPSLNVTGDMTIEAIVRFKTQAIAHYILQTGTINQAGLIFLVGSDGSIQYYTSQAGSWQRSTAPPGTFSWDTTYHIAAIRKGLDARVYLDAVDKTTLFGAHQDPFPSTTFTQIGSDLIIANRAQGIIDNLIYYNRALDLTEIQRHSERRYPS